MALQASAARLLSAAALGSLLLAQELPPPAFKYDVVSIHPAAPGERNSGFGPGAQGGLKARNNTAEQLLTFAYDVHEYQFVGLPGWARSDRFEINLTPDRSEIAPSPDSSRTEVEGWLSRNRQRMQAVLRDRFGLVIHAETKELPIYALTVAKSGHKLTAAKDPDHGTSFSINNGRLIVATSSTMKMLADSLSQVLGRSVRDETGLDSSFDFKVEFAPESAAADTSRPSIFTALTEQLGLRLEPRKGPVPVLVIDKIEKPTGN